VSRRLIVICALLALVVAAPARATAPTTGAPKLVEAGDSTFPERSYVLTLPSKTSLRADQLHVTENGQPVVGLTVVPSTAAGQTRFGTVLVIDASNSMRGKPFTSALAAARAFAARRGPTQPLAVIVFNARTAVLTPFTTSDAQIATALRSAPGLAQGTHIYDAIQAAVSLLERAHIASGSIVLLSDGADVGSVASSEDAVAAARKAHARVFTVGLRSAVFDAGTLARIAAQSGGDYSEAAKAKDLEPIFARLGYELSNQYLLRYRSLAGPDKKILVRLDVQGVSQPAVTGYVTPSLALTVAPPYKPAVGDRLIQSGVFMLVIALLVTALLILGLVAVFRPSGSTLLRRLSYFVTLPTASDDAERELRRDRLFAGAEKTLKGSPRWERFKENLEVAEIPIPAARLILWPAIAVLFFLFLAIFLRSFLLLLPALFIPLAEWQWISQTLARKRRAFADQLPTTSRCSPPRSAPGTRWSELSRS
jgi:VWFA-related protein